MTISISALKGYLLEEVLSKLLENCGYTLITKEVLKDSRNSYTEFVSQGNGMNIKGRGGTHQADVLGQFPISIPFNYPIRLFLEAKFKENKVGIDVVRSGIGILTDLNANYQTIDLSGDELLIQRYNYQYAIFSTSGFSENAIKLAIAYKITLIDLSGQEYAALLNAIESVANDVMYLISSRRISLNELRNIIRLQLFNLDIEDNILESENLRIILNPLFSEVNKYGDLYLASIDSPFSILLKPSSSEDLRTFLEESRNSTFDVRITWNEDNQNLWEISLNSNSNIRFTFYLPELLKEYIFENRRNQDIFTNALNAKRLFMGNIVFYVRNVEKFIIFKYVI